MTQAFYELEEFPEIALIQDNYRVILGELEANKVWINWGSDAYNKSGECLFLRGDWKVCPLFFGSYIGEHMHVPGITQKEKNELIKSLPDRFPKTTEILNSVYGINYAAFSRLFPKSSLEPHSHNDPTALTYHLGLVIPPGETCGLTVAGETHIWKEPGEAIIFNDTLEHSAWNDSDMDRIIFHLNFVNPDAPLFPF